MIYFYPWIAIGIIVLVINLVGKYKEGKITELFEGFPYEGPFKEILKAVSIVLVLMVAVLIWPYYIDRWF